MCPEWMEIKIFFHLAFPSIFQSTLYMHKIGQTHYYHKYVQHVIVVVSHPKILWNRGNVDSGSLCLICAPRAAQSKQAFYGFESLNPIGKRLDNLQGCPANDNFTVEVVQ